VATEILELFRLQPKMDPHNIINEIQRTHRIQISYDVAWAARELARTMIDGTHEESYASMPLYCQQLVEANPGSIISLEKNDMKQFHRLFVSYCASAKGFVSCKPLLGLDGTHLRSKYQGILLTATATDAQGQLFPLAFGVTDIEDKANWIWFLQKLREVLVEYNPSVINQENVLVLLSDRAKGLLEGVPHVFPLAAHGYCLKHLEKNLKSRYKDPKLPTLLWQMSASKTPEYFLEILKKLKDINPQAAEWLLKEADPKCWVDCYFPERRYGHYTSNIAESLNSWLLAAREQLLYAMMETIREKLTGWFAERREEGAKMQDEGFVPKVINQLRLILDKARDYVSMSAVDSVFEVKSQKTGHKYSVDLAKKSCTCFGFQATGYPCHHAARALLDHNYKLDDYVDSCFKVAGFRKTYENGILPPAAALDVDTLSVFEPTEFATSPSSVSEPDISDFNDWNC
jgi:zinc finger SWIM domain-containing protein 3